MVAGLIPGKLPVKMLSPNENGAVALVFVHREGAKPVVVGRSVGFLYMIDDVQVVS